MGREENNQLKLELKHFSGSDQFYRHPIYRAYISTDGVQYLAEKGQAHWLVDFIFIHQSKRQLKGQAFQVWNIKVSDADKATFTVEDGNHNKLIELKIPFTDFPLNELTLWLVNGTLMLPSEY